MEPAVTYSAGSRKERLKRKLVWGLSTTSKSHTLATKGGDFWEFLQQVSSRQLLVTSHPRGKTSLPQDKHSFPP